MEKRIGLLGQISATYNSTTETPRHCTAKQFKDRWSTTNWKVSLFNNIYNLLSMIRLSGSDDVMLLKATKETFHDMTNKIELKLGHMWCALCHQPKWCVRHGESSSRNASKRSRLNVEVDYSLALPESVKSTCSIGHNKARAQHNSKGLAMSSIESSIQKKITLKHLSRLAIR
jgi:hypothetical protein